MSYLFSESPWKIVKDPAGSINVVSNIQTVANVYATEEEFYSEFTQEANANLIVNAPEMYQLLEAILVLGERLPEKRPELRKRIQALFLKMGVTITQYQLKQEALLKQEVALNLAHQELEAEMRREEEAEILQKYFGDRWEDFEIHSADAGYHIVSKSYKDNIDYCGGKSIRYYDEEYFLLGTNDKEGVKPCYFDYSNWDYNSDEIAYVYQDQDSNEVLVDINHSNSYPYSDILEKFMAAGIEAPNMDLVAKLIRGQSIEELIEDYKKAEDKNESF